MNEKEQRQMIIELLDDTDGINDVGYALLYQFACETHNEDVVQAARCQDSRWFLTEPDAEMFRKTLDTKE
jgi:hypothetical protein